MSIYTSTTCYGFTAAVCTTLNEKFDDIRDLQSSTMPLLFKKYSIAGVTYRLITFNKTKFFTYKTKNTGRNGINKLNVLTHIKQSEKDYIGQG